jgi:predicted nuclease of predicted toxin-antitoxin system
MSLKFLVDMNLSPGWVELLANAGWDAVHWSSVGHADAPDDEIMEFARANGYVVLTQDLDFSAILAATHGSKPSVVQIRAQYAIDETMIEIVWAALIQMERELVEGAVLTIDAHRARVRLLPLRHG